MGRDALPFAVPDTSCAGGGGGGGDQVEGFVLCDFVDGEVVGSAIAVYEFDPDTGLPVGPPTFIDPATGDPYVVQGTLMPCDTGTASAAAVLSAHHFDATSGSPWTPALVGETLTSLTYSVLAGTADVTVDGVTVNNVPTGFSGSWSADDHNELTGITSIAPDADSRVLVQWTEREP